jgi:hypothetical protein
MTMATDPHLARVNARLDPAHAAKLEYLKRATGLAVSDIVKRGIDLAYDEARRASASPLDVLTAAGFVGSADGPAELSECYKQELAELLTAKHGDR